MQGRSLFKRLGALAAALVLAVGAGGLFAGRGLAADGGLLHVRLGGDAAGTRIVFDLAQSASPSVTPGKDQLVLNFAKLGSAGPASGAGQGLVKSWTIATSPLGAKVELQLAPGASIERRFMLPPADGVANYRYVIDLKGPAGSSAATSPRPALIASTPPKAAASAGPVVGAVAATAETSAKPALVKAAVVTSSPAQKKVIVIDAGHGGKDPGASGAATQEKAVNLAAALALRDALTKTGRYKVVMTRDSDRFIELNRRVATARNAKADLFISLHADSGPDAGRRGASVYTLSEQGSSRVGEILGRNDRFFTAYSGKDASVSRILLDLSQRVTKNRSAAFAETLLEHISLQSPLLERSHRDAGYYVLLAPDVPAVLLEMGFITNSKDEKALTDPKQRSAMMGAVADAIDAFFKPGPKLDLN